MAVFMCRPRTVDAVKYKGGLLFDSYPDWLIDMMREEDLAPAGADALWVGTGMGLRRIKDGDYILHNLSTGENSTATGQIFQRDYMPVAVDKGEE